MLQDILKRVEKPARYTGGEYNQPDTKKPHDAAVCLCFPETYEIGMSNLGLSILYSTLNSLDNVIAERCFAPWHDFSALIRQNNIPLMSLENKKPLKDFDILGFSLQYELTYTNVLYMLDLANIPFYAAERQNDCNLPIIIGGGPCSVSPLAYADFFDAALIGEGEEAIQEFVQLYIQHKKAPNFSKTAFLDEVANIQGFFVPTAHTINFEHGDTATTQPNTKSADKTFLVKKRYSNTFTQKLPTLTPLVPNIEIVHDRAVVELYRGCRSGCRFCQAAFFYRPIRERGVDVLKNGISKLLENTGFDEITLASLSTSDYSCLFELLNELKPLTNAKQIRLSLPSLRLDSFFGEFTGSSRKSSLTFAPEAGTQRLRNIINKNITDDDIVSSITQAVSSGYRSFKLYFMIGLPGETAEDIDGIIALVKKVREIYRSIKRDNALKISVSTSVFIPKPLTPFEREPMISAENALNIQKYLKSVLKTINGVNYHYHDAFSSQLECAMARGGRELSKVIESAYKSGCYFDAWSEHFKPELWQAAFEVNNLDFASYLRQIPDNNPLPWEFIDFLIDLDYLKLERQKAFKGQTTPPCTKSCNACGSPCHFGSA